MLRSDIILPSFKYDDYFFPNKLPSEPASFPNVEAVLELPPKAERTEDKSNPPLFFCTAETIPLMIVGKRLVAKLVVDEESPSFDANCEVKIEEAKLVIELLAAEVEPDNKEVICEIPSLEVAVCFKLFKTESERPLITLLVSSLFPDAAAFT